MIVPHELGFTEALEIYAHAMGGDPITPAAAVDIATDWDMACCQVEDRIRFLARHARRNCPV